MIGREKRVLLRHYLEQGMSKAAIARDLGISRRTVYRWIKTGQLDRELDDARTLKKISPRQYRYFWSELSRRGWKTREPESTDPPPEAPTLLRHMFERHFTDLGYSSNDLADALHATTKDIERLYPRFGSLRLVG